MSGSLHSTGSIGAEFKLAASDTSKKRPDRRKRVPPVSIRFNEDERKLLREHAGKEPLSTYVRNFVVKAHGGKVKRKKTATADFQDMALVLSALGRSELSHLLRDALSASESGALQLEPETEAALRQACEDIADMRGDLIKALGLRNEVEP